MGCKFHTLLSSRRLCYRNSEGMERLPRTKEIQRCLTRTRQDSKPGKRIRGEKAICIGKACKAWLFHSENIICLSRIPRQKQIQEIKAGTNESSGQRLDSLAASSFPEVETRCNYGPSIHQEISGHGLVPTNQTLKREPDEPNASNQRHHWPVQPRRQQIQIRIYERRDRTGAKNPGPYDRLWRNATEGVWSAEVWSTQYGAWTSLGQLWLWTVEAWKLIVERTAVGWWQWAPNRQ